MYDYFEQSKGHIFSFDTIRCNNNKMFDFRKILDNE